MMVTRSTAIAIVGEHEDRTIQQLQRCVDAEEGAIGILCADGHVGYSMPIGGVVGYRRHVSPSGVGYDIACGNLAVRTNLRADAISYADMDKLADEIQDRISFGMGRANNEPVDDSVLDEIALSPVAAQRMLLSLARQQLGTVGSGNHYLDVLEDTADGHVWIACHFGSRGFGHKTATGFMNIAQGRAFDEGKGEGEMDAPPLLLDAGCPSGQDYLVAMHLAGRYAYAGREAVVSKVLAIFGARRTVTVHNHHNFTWPETHDGESYFVVRKGATPAFPDQWGFVGGSMGDISVVLRGVNSEASKALLYSTVHGAGRIMSRTQAAGKQKWRKEWQCLDYRHCSGRLPIQTPLGFGGENPRCPTCGHKMARRTWMERLKTGVVDFEAEKAKLVNRHIILRGAGADEAPPVYRPLQSVLDAHAGTIDVVHVLQPRIVVMARADVFDPYKD